MIETLRTRIQGGEGEENLQTLLKHILQSGTYGKIARDYSRKMLSLHI